MKNTNFKITLIATIVLLGLVTKTAAQGDSIKYNIGIMGLESTGKSSPFWFHSNQFGTISNDSASANLWVGISKEFSAKPKLFDYGFKLNALLQTTSSGKTDAYLHELYVQARFSVLNLIIGSKEEIIGNQDSTLSSGGILFSTNSRPMPKITAGILKFTPIPYTFGLIEVKGALSHGWFSKQAYEKGAYLHHKYMYVRVGGNQPIHVQYGIDHAAMWGGNPSYLGNQPFNWSNYKAVFLGRSGGSGGEIINALGNHIISQSIKLEGNISNFEINAYWQNISEDGPIKILWNSVNVADGLWGLSIKNTKLPFVKKILYEYTNTTDQSGPYHDKDGILYGGADSYFYNYVYYSGWTYMNRIIGTPLISNPIFNNNGEMVSLNNKIQAHHFGVEGDIYSYRYRILTTFSKNYGDVGGNYQNRNNTSLLFELNKKFAKLYNVECGISIGSDFGKLYGESWGLKFSLRKTGNLFQLNNSYKK